MERSKRQRWGLLVWLLTVSSCSRSSKAEAAWEFESEAERQRVATCLEQLLPRGNPQIIFGLPGTTMDKCFRSDIPMMLFGNVTVKAIPPLMEAVEKIGLLRNFEPHVEDWRELELELCVPDSCSQKEFSVALYILAILRLPDDPMQAVEFSRSQSYVQQAQMEISHVPRVEGNFYQACVSAAKLDQSFRKLKAQVERLKRLQYYLPAAEKFLNEAYDPLGGTLATPEISAGTYSHVLSMGYNLLADKDLPILFGGEAPDEASDNMMVPFKKAFRLLQDTFNKHGAALGHPALQELAASEVERLRWPLRGPSKAEIVFPNVPPSVLPVFKFTDVCIRDLTDETDFFSQGHAVPGGRRLQLITLKLPGRDEIALKERPLHGRFVVTQLQSGAELADLIRGRYVHSLSRSSIFMYDGHKPSTRCPDCANIDHMLVDDMLLELAAWRLGGEDPANLVLNSFASVGKISPKVWFQEFTKHLAGDVEILQMQAGDIFCFNQVTLSLHSGLTARWRGLQDHLFVWNDGALHDEVQMSDVLNWARWRIWSSVYREQKMPVPIKPFVMFARQDEDQQSNKPRQWLDYKSVVDAFGAELISFKSLSFVEEVQLMSCVQNFLTVPGGHRAAVLFMRPGALWLELVCWKTRRQNSYASWLKMVQALGVRYERIEAAGCPDVAGMVDEDPEVWIDLDWHPAVFFEKLYSDLRVLTNSQACFWRHRPAVESKMIESEPLEVVVGLQTAMGQCAYWEADCQSLRGLLDGKWALLRFAEGEWLKQGCVEYRDGKAKLTDRTSTVPHSFFDLNLRAPDDVVDRIHALIAG